MPASSRPPRKRTGRQRAVLSVGVAVVVCCLLGGTFLGYEIIKLGTIDRQDLALADTVDEQPQNWLVVGSDSRDAIDANDGNTAVFTGGGENTGGRRSDTIMVVRIDPGATQLEILSLQRDLWLPIAGTDGSERINSAYSYPDGPQRLIDTIEQNFGIEINHYAEIDFEGFQGIVEAVGGVPMYVDAPMRDKNSGLDLPTTGCVTLDGYQALAFSRSRHLQYSNGVQWVDDPSGDLGRISRQQFFMRRMFDRAASQAFSNPKTLHDLVDVAVDYVTLDQDLDVTKVAAMGQRFGQFEGDSIKTYTLPVVPYTTAGGAAVLKLDPDGTEEILDIFRGTAGGSSDGSGDLPPSEITFSVENGSGVTGQANEVKRVFDSLGYDVSFARDHGSFVDRTEVRYAPGGAAKADQIARHLNAGADLVADDTLPEGRIVLVTGKDFTTVSAQARPFDPSALPADETPATSSPATSAPSAGGSSKGSTVGSSSASGAGTTTTTDPANVLYNDDEHVVGVVPEPPDGIVCE